jgi:hypothetical protein
MIRAVVAALGCGLVACGGAATGTGAAGPMEVDETRAVELHALRLEVRNFEEVLTRDDLRRLPPAVSGRLWLLDLDLSGGPALPRLLENALAALRGLDPATLDPATRSARELITMTPQSADLRGTQFEQLVTIAPLLGIAPARVLADLHGVGADDPLLPRAALAEAILELIIASHPNARLRPGPVTEANPDGLYPVRPGALPITLADAVSDFATLAERFGPAGDHPGFLAGPVSSRVLTDDFRLVVRASGNAMPYRGLDLTDLSPANVNSLRSQGAALFDFSDPGWLRIEGLVSGEPVIDTLRFRIGEADGFAPGGHSPLPVAQGQSPAWDLPPWTLERVVVSAAQRAYRGVAADLRYARPGQDEPLFTAAVRDGWQEIAVAGGIGDPPAPSYLWDLAVELAQVKLHGSGLAEGRAQVELPLTDVPVGIDTRVIEQAIRDNLRADPEALVDIASLVIDTSSGAADFYYHRAGDEEPTGLRGDWLFFVEPADIRRDASGRPERPYAYTTPGFYADEALTVRVSSRQPVGGDVAHEKVRVAPGDTLYVADDQGAVYRLQVGDKRSPARLALQVTRVR